jgi:excisionase family DNA binding protein
MCASPARLLDIEEAAWYLNQTPRWVRGRWSAKELPGVKLGKSVRFRLEDLDRYVAEHLQEAVAQ